MDALNIFHEIELSAPSLLMGFNGWMDGGDVSTGTMEYIRVRLGLLPIAEIIPDGFYIMSFPGTMEYASMFRPHVKIQNGQVKNFDYQKNTFYASEKHNVIIFEGQEPNFSWEAFGECIFTFCEAMKIRRILFIGSVAGLVPHTREARVNCVISSEKLRSEMERKGFRFTNYEGPGSFITYLTQECDRRDIEMTSLVAEIPAYVQGYNPRSIETAIRCVSSLLELQMDSEDLRTMGDEFEKRVNELVTEQPELAQRVQQLEEIYDNEVFDSEMSDLKTWLQRRGVRLD